MPLALLEDARNAYRISLPSVRPVAEDTRRYGRTPGPMSGVRNNFDRSRPPRAQGAAAAGRRSAGAGRWAEPIAAAGSPFAWPAGPAGGPSQYATPFAGDAARRQPYRGQFAAARISGPATALTVVAWLNLVSGLFLIMMAIFIIVVVPHAGRQKFGPQGPDPAQAMVGGILYLVKGVIDIGVSIFLLIGSAEMKRTQELSPGHGDSNRRHGAVLPPRVAFWWGWGSAFGPWSCSAMRTSNRHSEAEGSAAPAAKFVRCRFAISNLKFVISNWSSSTECFAMTNLL